MITGGESLVSHAGGALLVETARRSGLTKELSTRLRRRPFATHDPGKVGLDLAVAVALGGDAACDVGVLRAQPGVFGAGGVGPDGVAAGGPARRGRRRRARGDQLGRGPRILAVAGRIVRTARRRTLHIDPALPWAEVITTAHQRLCALPVPDPDTPSRQPRTRSAGKPR